MTALEFAPRTVDAFHRGRFLLVQPEKGAHRAGMDAMVLAAAVPDDFAGDVADLGAGSGAAALAVLSRCPAASATLVERSAEMADCARATLAHRDNIDYAARARVIEADVTAPGAVRRDAGLEDNSHDFAIMNPPFNSGRDRRSPKALKADAHVMDDALLESWIRTAASLVRPGGGLAVIARPASLAHLLNACENRFGALQVKPAMPLAGKAAIRVVVRGIKGSRAATSLEPQLILHEGKGNTLTPAAEAIINGQAELFS